MNVGFKKIRITSTLNSNEIDNIENKFLEVLIQQN
jgi:hypothetical protein